MDAPRLYLVRHAFPPRADTQLGYWYARTLADAGFEVTVLAAATPSAALGGGEEDPDTDIRDPDLAIALLPTLNWGLAGRTLARLGLLHCPHRPWAWTVAAELRKRLAVAPGIVLVQAPPWSGVDTAVREAVRADCPIVVDFRADVEPAPPVFARQRYAERWRATVAKTLRQASLISVCTTTLAAWLQELTGFDATRLVMTRNGWGGPEPVISSTPSPSDVLTILSLAPATARHQPELLAQAYCLLEERSPAVAARVRVEFSMPNTRRARGIIEPLRNPGRIDLLGYLPPSARPHAIAEADIGYVPLLADSPCEEMPETLLQFIAHGKPVLTMLPSGHASTVLLNSGAGLAVEPGDVVALAVALGELATNDKLREGCAERACLARGQLTLREQVLHLAAVMRQRFC